MNTNALQFAHRMTYPPCSKLQTINLKVSDVQARVSLHQLQITGKVHKCAHALGTLTIQATMSP